MHPVMTSPFETPKMLAREAEVAQLNREATITCPLCEAAGRYEPVFSMRAVMSREQAAAGDMVGEIPWYGFECGSSWSGGQMRQSPACAAAERELRLAQHQLTSHVARDQHGQLTGDTWGHSGVSACSCGFELEWDYERDLIGGYDARDVMQLHRSRPDIPLAQIIGFWRGHQQAEMSCEEIVQGACIAYDDAHVRGRFDERAPAATTTAHCEGMYEVWRAIERGRSTRGIPSRIVAETQLKM